MLGCCNMSRYAAVLAVLLLLCAAVPSRSQPPKPAATLSTATACPTSAADFAKSSMISASVDAAAGTMTIKYTGCPRHNWSTQTTPNTATYSCASTTVKWPPTIQAMSNAKTIGVYVSKTGSGSKNSSPLQGPIGVTLDAVVLFGNGDAELRDAYVFEGATFDTTCGGHASPTGQFHYHSEPKSGCVAVAVAGKHSPLLGIMTDGVPLYGALGDGGVVPSDLDDCNGHRDTTNPFYHYHVTANMQYPYLMNCLRGCLMTGSCLADTSLPTMNYDSVKTQMLAASATDYSCSGAGLSQAAIIAIIVCSCVGGLILIVSAAWYIRRRRRMNAADKADGSYAPPGAAAPPAAVVEMQPVHSLPNAVQTPGQLQPTHTLKQA